MALNYGEITGALATVLAAVDYSSLFNADNRVTKVRVVEEGMARELALDQMPVINCRMVKSFSENRSMPNGYYEKITIEVDIHAFDFTSFRNATTLRDGILAKARDAVQAAKAFHSDLETSSIAGDIEFVAYGPESGGHVASCTFQVVAEGYIEAT